jgi:hypothetical protein
MWTMFAAGLVGSAHAAEAAPEQGPWSEPHRYFVQSTVQLPLFMWFATPFNRQARATAFDLRMVLACGAATPNTRRTSEVLCEIEELALSASGMEQEQGLLQPILTELDENLTGTDLQLQVRGSEITNIDLEAYRMNTRVGRLNENMRLVFSRAVAGLDFAQPPADGPDGPIDQWPEYGSMLPWMPAANGTSGMSEIVYSVTDRTPQRLSLAFGGVGMVQPGDGQNRYDTRVSGELVIETSTGRPIDRTWTVVASPTPSSLITQGYAGYPYLQQGRLVALRDGETWDVGESLEVPASEFGQTAIQQMFQLGSGSPSGR